MRPRIHTFSLSLIIKSILASVLIASHGAALDIGSPQQEVHPVHHTELSEFWTGLRLDDGRMLFAGEGKSISIYDGWKWVNHSVPINEAIWCMERAGENQIWVGLRAGFGLLTITEDGAEYQSISGSMETESSTESIYQIYTLEDTVFFCGKSTIYSFKNSTVAIHRFPEQAELFPFQFGHKVYCKSGASLYEWNGSRFEWEVSNPSFLSAQIFLSWMDADGTKFLLTRNGIETLEADRLTLHTSFEAMGMHEVIPARSSKKSRDIFIPTWNNGAALLNTQELTSSNIIPRHFIDFRNIENVVIEDNDFVWLVTRHHLFRVKINPGSRIYHYTLNYPHTGYFDIDIEANKLYFSCNEGVFKIDLNQPNPEPEPIVDNVVYGLTLHQGDIYITSPWDFIRLSEDLSYETIIDDIVSISSRVLLDGSTWVTTQNDVRHLVPHPDGWKEVASLSGFQGAAVQSVTDPEGGRWVATNTGQVVRYATPSSNAVQYDQPARIGTDTFEPSSANVGLFSLDGRPFILTEKHLFAWQSGAKFEPVIPQPAESTSDDWEWVVPLHFPEDPPIWLLRKHRRYQGYQIGQVKLDEAGLPVWTPRAIGSQEFLGPIRKIQGFDSNTNHRVALTGTDGIHFMDLSQLPSVLPPRTPTLRFSNPTMRRLASRELGAAFEEGSDVVPSFEYSIPHFRTDEPMFFQTRLTGLETQWSEPSRLTTRAFPGLKDGRFSFEVRTVNGNGAASKPAILHFRVLPPWYKTAPAFIGYALALILLGFMLFYMRLRESNKRRMELEIKVRERTAELEKANRVKSEFVANMSHEIRNPMNGIINNVRLLRPLEPVDPNLLQSLSYSSGYLNRLVKNILDFSKIDSDKRTITKAWFNPFSLRGTVSHLFEDMAQKNQIALIIAYYGPPSVSIYSDQSRIEQILVNLISNAIRFTTEGSVRVGMRLQSVSDHKATLTLWVKDTGTGIAPEDQQRIFQPFEQGSTASPMGPDEKGTGLGLAIVKDIIETLGGEQHFESAIGQGTSFRIAIPVGLRTLETTETGASKEKTILQGRYLITDDQDYNVSIFKAFMQQWNATLDIATCGSDAFELMKERRYDAIFLDWSLPDYKGPEIARMIRKGWFPLNTETPLIAQTAYTSDVQKQVCRDAGMNAFIEKPFSPEKILEQLTHLCPTRVQRVPMEDADWQASSDTMELPNRNEVNFETSRMMAMIHQTQLGNEVEKEILIPVKKLVSEIEGCNEADELNTMRAAVHQIKNLLGIVQAHRSVAFFGSFQEAIDRASPEEIRHYRSRLSHEAGWIEECLHAHLAFEDAFEVELPAAFLSSVRKDPGTEA